MDFEEKPYQLRRYCLEKDLERYNLRESYFSEHTLPAKKGELCDAANKLFKEHGLRILVRNPEGSSYIFLIGGGNIRVDGEFDNNSLRAEIEDMPVVPVSIHFIDLTHNTQKDLDTLAEYLDLPGE